MCVRTRTCPRGGAWVRGCQGGCAARRHTSGGNGLPRRAPAATAAAARTARVPEGCGCDADGTAADAEETAAERPVRSSPCPRASGRSRGPQHRGGTRTDGAPRRRRKIPCRTEPRRPSEPQNGLRPPYGVHRTCIFYVLLKIGVIGAARTPRTRARPGVALSPPCPCTVVHTHTLLPASSPARALVRPDLGPNASATVSPPASALRVSPSTRAPPLAPPHSRPPLP